ncbi:hypothetical protein EOD39_21900 [Acipenser ruthenus]|uniref:HAT C-terminal dimerisation domain-containing protein n=1 Tax=Acipenser ruthenus TaxID=7906 RepID=A0A444URE3_ACIRT|nr:hypothetical protein EOD39_21900 [Acipenser ruthenus]
MCDALQELSEPSVELQKRVCTIIEAHRAIFREVREFEAMAEQPGRYTQLSQKGIEENVFEAVTLNVGKPSDKKLCQRQFFWSLARNMEDRMLSQGGRVPDKTGYSKLIEELKVLYKQYWHDKSDALYGQTKVESLCQRCDIECPCTTIRAYRRFRESNGQDLQSELNDLFVAVNTIAISSAECERGFSQMNLICISNRAALHVSTIASLLFLNLVGPPLTKFNPVPYVKSWIAKGHRSATDSQSKSRKREEGQEDMTALWTFLMDFS